MSLPALGTKKAGGDSSYSYFRFWVPQGNEICSSSCIQFCPKNVAAILHSPAMEMEFLAISLDVRPKTTCFQIDFSLGVRGFAALLISLFRSDVMESFSVNCKLTSIYGR